MDISCCVGVEDVVRRLTVGLQVVGGLPEDTPEAPEIPTVKGHQLLGGPQMIQLRYCPVLACCIIIPLFYCVFTGTAADARNTLGVSQPVRPVALLSYHMYI